MVYYLYYFLYVQHNFHILLEDKFAWYSVIIFILLILRLIESTTEHWVAHI